MLEFIEMGQQPLHRLRIIDFMIAETLSSAITCEQTRYQCLLMDILAIVFVLINPEVGKHLLYLHGHQTTEYGIAGILRRCRQNAHVKPFIDVETVGKFFSKYAPLIVSEVVDDEQKHLFFLVEKGENLLFEHIVAHHWTVFRATHPSHIMPLNIF